MIRGLVGLEVKVESKLNAWRSLSGECSNDSLFIIELDVTERYILL